jgi:hypothetical protein
MMDAISNNELAERAAKRRQQNVACDQRHRKRAKDGGVSFRMEITSNDIAALIAVGALAENQRQDRDAIRDAVKLLSVEGWRARRRANAEPRLSKTNQRLLAILES